MQGLILAAGMGNRLGEYTNGNTKCMVEVNGEKLINLVLEQLYNCGIRKTIMVIGYKGENVKKYLGSNYNGMEIEYVENSIYDKTNNIYSLWLAKDKLIEDDTILIESDLIFEEKILKDLIESKDKNSAVVSKFERWMDGTVTVLNEKREITSFIPGSNFDWSATKDYYKTVNIYKFSKEFSENTYIPFLEAYIKTLGNNEYYEQVLRVISHLTGVDFKAQILNDEKWYEIDDAQDLDIASAIFAKGEDKLEKFQKRYGGYWRFPRVKDFCYLVNPYFPNKEMLDEFKYNFDTLLSEYPSGQGVQNLLAGKMFSCNPKNIIVGNGAAELIKIITNEIDGKFGVIFPTFNEYPERIGYDRVKQFIPQNKDFKYSSDELIEFAKKIEALILINPDNPSGHFLRKEDIIKILDSFEKTGKYLILDESFVDFAGKEEMYSAIENELMEKYNNLIVIKSISKSYGVPGSRLGILATANKNIMDRVKKEVSIWNINSFGEYFLQIFGKYSKVYQKACYKIANERDRFYSELENISFLNVVPSKANYFLCELTNEFTATQLATKLLNDDNLYIKDLTGKIGVEGNKYIRIAVRNKNDNDYLINILKKSEK